MWGGGVHMIVYMCVYVKTACRRAASLHRLLMHVCTLWFHTFVPECVCVAVVCVCVCLC